MKKDPEPKADDKTEDQAKTAPEKEKPTSKATEQQQDPCAGGW